MLILVGVTINVALNGGLIEKARTAGEQTQKQVEKEELISIAIGAYSSKNDSVLLSELTSEIDTTKYEYDSEKSNEDKYVVKGKKSGTIWQIDLKTAKVTEYEEEDSIYKVAYEVEMSGMKEVIYLINDELLYIDVYVEGQKYSTTFQKYDISSISISEDNNTLSLGGTDLVRNKNNRFSYNPILDESGVYKDALYTTVQGSLDFSPYRLETGCYCGKYFITRLDTNNDVGDNAQRELNKISSEEAIEVSNSGKTITWRTEIHII